MNVSFVFESSVHKTPLVFVHGMGGTASVFKEQVSFFRDQYSIYGLDLPGHGSAPAAETHSIEYFAEELFNYLKRAAFLTPPVIVAHSLGAVVATMAKSQHHIVTSGLIALDPPVLMPTEMAPAMKHLTEVFHGPHYREALIDFASQAFFTDYDSEELKNEVIESLTQLPKKTFLDMWTSLQSFEPTRHFPSWNDPALFIRSGVALDLNEVTRLIPHALIGQTVGAGHYALREVPQQINPMINRFLKVALK